MKDKLKRIVNEVFRTHLYEVGFTRSINGAIDCMVDQAHKDILALLPSKDKLFDFLIQMPLSFTEEPVDYGEIAKAIHDLMVKSVKGEGK